MVNQWFLLLAVLFLILYLVWRIGFYWRWPQYPKMMHGERITVWTRVRDIFGGLFLLLFVLFIGYIVYQQIMIRTSWMIVEETVARAQWRKYSYGVDYYYVIDGKAYGGYGRAGHKTSDRVIVRANPDNPSESRIQRSITFLVLSHVIPGMLFFIVGFTSIVRGLRPVKSAGLPPEK